ncbi:unnamed protein product [Prunus brigantina]
MKHISLSSSTELAQISISVDIEFDEIAISVVPFSRPSSSRSPSPFLVATIFKPPNGFPSSILRALD